ncbi:MAG: hypothetical protein QOH81_1961 [Sphingomonadales bacterium]|jgi:tetratricopeptide (TPR) repeat protein|nr:hypothetical protein [Sphingomonadales bacterium]
MSILLISLALAGVAPPPEAPAQAEQTIVVTGTPLRETERALRDCLARKCPPNEDINASLAHAENLFVAGKYQDARSVTLASIGRNHRYGRTYPIDVSDLYRANSRIAAHLGEGGDYEFSVSAMQRTLNEGLQKTDPRVINAKIEWADMYASLGRIDRARQVYQEAERKAEAAGRPDLAGIARVRAAWLHQIEGDSWLTRQALTKIAEDRSPNARLARLSALVLLARLDRKQGNAQSSSALIDEMRGTHSRRPVLLFAPKIESTQRLPEGDNAEGMTGSTTNLMATDNFEDRWIDVGFWVTADGRVNDAEILRSQGPTEWTKSLLRSIAGRIYSPIEDSLYRVERYSYTSRWMNVTGTRIRQRSPNPRIEYVDLTVEPPAGSH